MEEKDTSNFSGLGKTFFSEIVSSEVAMRNLNAEEEKKSKIEAENQEIKENQEINVEGINNIEQNPEEIGARIEIGEFEKNGLATSNQTAENQKKREIIKAFPLESNDSESMSQNSGLDDAGSENHGKGQSATTIIVTTQLTSVMRTILSVLKYLSWICKRRRILYRGGA